MKQILVIISTLVLSSCASLTEKGEDLTVYDSQSRHLVSDCKRLGEVRGKSKVFGAFVGRKEAYVDARNQAGELPGADTIVIMKDDVKFTKGEVRAHVYNCKEQRVQVIKSEDK